MKRQRLKKRKRYYRKRGATGWKNKRQRGGILSRYGFAYTGRDTVNQASKVAPEIVKQARNDIDQMVKNRLNQATSAGGAEIERALPEILRGAIDVYKTPFRLLGNFGKQQFNKIKRKILR